MCYFSRHAAFHLTSGVLKSPYVLVIRLPSPISRTRITHKHVANRWCARSRHKETHRRGSFTNIPMRQGLFSGEQEREEDFQYKGEDK